MFAVAFLLGLAVFIGIALFFVGLARSQPVDPLEQRLSALNPSASARSLEELELQAPFFERTVIPTVRRFSSLTSRFTSNSFSVQTDRRLSLAGNPGGLEPTEWLGVKVVSAAVISFAAVFIGAVATGDLMTGVMIGVGGLFLGYAAPEMWLSRRVRARQRAIIRQIPDALDLLTISVRAGLGFDGALAKVVEKMRGPLIDEFRRALAEVRVGSTRRDALRAIIPRTEVAPLSNFISAIIQAEQLGVAISKVLAVQSEQLRIERRQRAEESAAKAPIKMLFPLVGCIFPSLFIVILGPAVILIVNNLGNIS